MKVIVAGQGAFGTRHLEAMQQIDGIEVVSLTGGRPESTKQVAETLGISEDLVRWRLRRARERLRTQVDTTA